MSRLTQGEQDLAFWTKHLKGEQCFVYVIQGDPDTPIKVGRAKDVPARMATLQTGSWQKLRLLHVLPGDGELEWQLHRRLRGCRVSGEWFSGPKVPALLELVEQAAVGMVEAYNRSGQPPAWENFITRFSRPKGKVEREMTVRVVEPDPVDPEEAKRRLASHWARPYRNQRLDAA